MSVKRLLSRVSMGLALLVTLTSLADAQAAQDRLGAGVVRGIVEGHFRGDVRPLSFAVVEAVAGSIRRSVLADSAGRYALSELPPGEARLRVSRAGYATLSLSVLVPERGTVTLDLQLEANPVLLSGVRVRSDALPSSLRGREDDDTAAPNPEVELRALELGPGLGGAGLVDVVGSLPGNDPADATDVLFLRGSTTDLKLVLLDGVPVYTPFHVAGLLKSFEPSVLGAADLHVGGAPARFDGGLSHILDLRTRTARRDRVRFSGAVDLLSASGALEAPLADRVGFIFSARSLHDLGTPPLGGPRPYGYRDALLSADAELADGHELGATAFWNTESVVLDPARSPDDARWSNRAASLRYRADLDGALLELTGGLSRYRAGLPLQPSRLPGEPRPPTLQASALTDRVRLLAEATWGSAQAPLRAGLTFDRIVAAFDARSSAGGASAASRGASSALGAFVDVTRPLVTGVTARAGLRVDHFTPRTTRLAPRAALMLEVGPEALLTVAAGRYHQATRTPDVEVERTLAEVAVEGLGSEELLPVATADHVVVSLDQRLAASVRLGLEGFWKAYENLPTTDVDEIVRSSGVELRVLTAGDGGAAWLGYGLSWFWSTVDLSGHGSDFSGRHLLSAGLSGGLGGPLEGEVRVAYGAGLPYTSIPFGTAGAGATTDQSTTPFADPARAAVSSPLVRGLDESFLRLDLEVHAVLEPRWGGREWRVRPYVRLLNALDRRDALFYTFQPWRSDTVTPLAERALLPLFGVSVSF